MTYKLRSRYSTLASEERKLSTYERLNLPVAPLIATFNSSHRVHVSLLGVPKPRLNSLLTLAYTYPGLLEAVKRSTAPLFCCLALQQQKERGEGERNFLKLDLLFCLYNVIMLALIHSWINRNYWPTSGWLLSIKRKLSFIVNLIISDLMVYDVIFSLSLSWFETKTYANWFRQNFIKVTFFRLTLK